MKRKKIKTLPLPKDCKLWPLRVIDLSLSAAKAKATLKQEAKSNSSVLFDQNLLSHIKIFKLDFYDIYCAISSLDKTILELDFIGFKLIKVRAQEIIDKKSISYANQKIIESKKKWSELFK